MKIAASSGASTGLSRQKPSRTAYEAPERPRSSLPAVIPATRTERADTPSPRFRPSAALLVQILAGAEDMPAVRAKRRIDPVEGSGIYRSIAELAPATSRRDRVV